MILFLSSKKKKKKKRERLEFELFCFSAQSSSSDQQNSNASRWTLNDFEQFFHSFEIVDFGLFASTNEVDMAENQ